MARNLILVAGYPKSGSTWIRLIFETLVRPLDGPTVLNELSDGFYGLWRRLLFDDIAPAKAADLLPEEIDDFLPGVFRQLASELPGPVLVKVHDLAFRTRSGEWLYPPDCVRCVIYLVRHPFDVAVSLANHVGLNVERTVELMNRDQVMALEKSRLIFPLHERIGSWSGNTSTWLDDAPYPLTLIRYEDLHADPEHEFGRAAAATGFTSAPESIRRAVESLRFDRLQAEERTHGFNEKPRKSLQFFRSGRPRSWEGMLDPVLRERLVTDHGAMMERLGYTVDGGIQPLPARPLEREQKQVHDSGAG